MAAVTICSDFGAQNNKVCHCFHVSLSTCHEVMGPDAMILVFECWVLRQFSHSPLSLSSRVSLVPLRFLPQGWCNLHIWGHWYFSKQSCFQLVLHPAQHFTWCILHVSSINKVTIYSLEVLLFQFWIKRSQDGGLEGCMFIFSWENTEITISCSTTIHKIMLDPTKKRYITSKGKGEATTRQ